MRRRRRFDTFSLSFLDIMSCGFGSVILLFMVINATMAVRSDELNRALSLEAEALKVEVSDGRENLVALRNSLAETEEREIRAQGASRRIIELLEQKKQELATMEADTLARRESINKLKADLQSMEEASKRLSAASSQPDEQGSALRRIRGQGQRQYLTGLRLGGSRVLILLDSSASMLDETIVNIIRRRNMSDAEKVRSPKWLRAQRTVEWIIARLSPSSQFQIITFNETAKPVTPGTRGSWLEAAEPDQVRKAIEGARAVVPGGGTSLYNAFTAAGAMSPPPDNIILLTDGLPTQGKSPPLVFKSVDAKARRQHFRGSLRQLPSRVPVNVILFPIEGDPEAAVEFWRLAKTSDGSFISPSKDWP